MHLRSYGDHCNAELVHLPFKTFYKPAKRLGLISSRCSGNKPTLLPRTSRGGTKTRCERAAEIKAYQATWLDTYVENLKVPKTNDQPQRKLNVGELSVLPIRTFLFRAAYNCFGLTIIPTWAQDMQQVQQIQQQTLLL